MLEQTSNLLFVKLISRKRAAERLLWQKFAILSGIRLVCLACLVYDVRTNPSEAYGFFKNQQTNYL